MSNTLTAVFYLKVRKRKIGGWGGTERELVARLTERPPKNVGNGEYVVCLRLKVPASALNRTTSPVRIEIPEEAIEATWENA